MRAIFGIREKKRAIFDKDWSLLLSGIPKSSRYKNGKGWDEWSDLSSCGNETQQAYTFWKCGAMLLASSWGVGGA